ncbi:MAG: FHA domain-containing protein [Pseudomonadota bacterium]
MPQLIASVDGVEIKHVYLEKDRTTLGRKPHNDIVFNNTIVSGEHCVFDLRGIADVFIEDLHSTNGTYINGHMIKSRQQLHDKDVIAVGNFRIRFLASSEHQVPETTEHEETTAMSISTLQSLGFEGSSGALHASLKVLSGSSAGLEVPVVKAVTTFGQPGVAVVAISHRRNGYFVSRVGGDSPATLNGQRIGTEALALEHHDVLELAGTAMEFLLKGA